MKYLSTIFLSFFFLNAFSQIGFTPEQIIAKQNNTDFKKEYLKNDDGSTDYNSWRIIFSNENETKASGKYTQLQSFYFLKFESGEEVCYQYSYTEPLSEANGWINYYNQQKWVKTEGKLEWIDYGDQTKRNIYIDETCEVYIRFFSP